MINNSVFDPVRGPFQVEHLCRYLCDKYKLGKFVSYDLNHSCDDNFNFAIVSEKNKYFVKIFNLKYNENFANDYVERYMPFDKRTWVKLILDNNNSKVTRIKIDDERVFFICVMEFIEGERLVKISDEDVEQIVDYLVELKDQACDIDILHNKASFMELEDNFEEYGEYLPEKYHDNIKLCIENMKKIRYRNLKKCCIHNALSSETMLKENGMLYLISFSHSGYGYRLLDVISVMNSLLFDGTNLENIVYFWNKFLSSYKKKFPFTVEESKNFDLLFNADCYAKLLFYRYNYKIKKNKEFKKAYKDIVKLLKFLEGKEIRV